MSSNPEHPVKQGPPEVRTGGPHVVTRVPAHGVPPHKVPPGGPRPAVRTPPRPGAPPIGGPVPTMAFGGPETKRSLRMLPGLFGASLRLVFRAAPREAIVTGVAQLMVGLGTAAMLLFLRALLGLAQGGSLHGKLTEMLLWVLAIGVVLAVVAFMTTYLREQMRIVADLVTRHASGQILDVAAVVDLAAFEAPEFHDRLQRAQSEAQSRPVFLTQNLFMVGTSLIMLTGILAALALVQPLLLPLVALTMAPRMLGVLHGTRDFYEFMYKLAPTMRLRSYFMNALTSREMAKEVRVFALARYLRDRFEAAYDHQLRELKKHVRKHLGVALASSLVSSAALILTLGALALFIETGRMDLAAAGAAAAGMVLLAQNLQQVVVGVGNLYECALFIDDYTSFLALKPQAEAARPSGPAPAELSQLRVRDVHFRYPGSESEALRGVSIDMGRDEVVALVGENGSGKTTLVKLISSLYRPDSGTIAWNGVDVSTVGPDELRRSIAVIFQDFAQWALSARDNVAVGSIEQRDDLARIRAAAAKAGADELLAGLPRGYETQLGREFEGGEELSMGQWQRVALARAFFRDTPVIILDEPTASLDPRAEHALFNRIRELCQGRSVLLISHRFSSVRSADRIYVLKEGTVVEHGSHDELMRLDGLYAELFNLQASAYLEPTAAT